MTPDPLYSSEQFISELLPVFAADDPQDSPALVSTVQRGTIDAGRLALFPAFRQVCSALLSPAFSPSAGLRCHKLNPNKKKSPKNVTQTERIVWVTTKVQFYLKEV